ncbi:MAG: DUF1134 domain-containing protein [Alphaproteobacteria bacterium]|nr:DUF1134 domain-containing protein [Alphaproteobacteria bacterium]MBE8219955.1 DUF1134 domain-containing protein [Alphaproteobacteria bacterium]
MQHFFIQIKHIAILALLFVLASSAVFAEPNQVEDFSKNSVVVASAKYLGSTAESMAEAMDVIFNRYGAPDAIIRGEELGGGFIGTLRYGRGSLQFQTGGTHSIYWRGPSIGLPLPSGAASKNFILIYGAKTPKEVYKRFFGIEGSLIVGAGIALNYLQRDDVVVVPVRVGVGFRADVSVGYLKFTEKSGWFPF